MNAIAVMWQRQLKLYLRSKHRLFASLAQPLLFMVAFGFGFGPIFEQAGEGNYIQYLVPGIVAMTLLFSSVFNGISLIWDKNFGFLKETLVAPVSRIEILFGRCMGGATTSTLQGLFIIGISFFFGYRVSSWVSFPFAVVFMFMISLIFTLLGTSIATKIDDMQAFPTIMNFLIMPMFFLSGALFPIHNFPGAVKVIAQINPMTYCVDLMKYALDSTPAFTFFLDIGVVISLIVLLSMAGTYLFNRIET